MGNREVNRFGRSDIQAGIVFSAIERPETYARDLGVSIQAVFDSMDGDERRRKVFDTALFKMEYVGELEGLRQRHIEAFEESRAKFARDLEAAAALQSVSLRMGVGEAALGLHSLFVGLIHGWVLSGGDFPLAAIGRMSVDAYLSGLGFELSPSS